MTEPNFTVLYVNDLAISKQFYTDLLGKPPMETSPNFALFTFASGMMFGLWSRQCVEPPVMLGGGGGEMVFSVASNDEVDAIHAEWGKRKLVIAQTPCSMDFGYTFTALDPDGHRLRVYAPSER